MIDLKLCKGTIQDWAVHRGEGSPYLAPEQVGIYVTGALGPRYISTSRVETILGRYFVTKSGSIYRLGRVKEDYLTWLKSQGYKYNRQHPLRMVKA